MFVLTGLLTFGINAQQIENGGFEGGTYTSTYGTADPTGYGVLNFDGAGGPVGTTLSTTDPYEGGTSVVLTTTTGYAAIGLPNDTYPGYLFARDIFTGAESDVHTERLQSVSFVYKSDLVGQDSAFFYMELTNDAATLIGNTSFYTIGGQNATWTEVNVPFGYVNGDPVDSLYIAIASSGGNPNVAIEPGSVLEIDRIILCKEFAIDFVATVVGDNVDFTSTTSATGNGNVGNLSWDFGDGSNTSTDLNPSHVYSTNNTYTVGLTVTDSCGNDSTYTKDVVISEVSLSQEEIINANIYPNPTTGILNVTAAENLSRVVVYNLVGRKVMDVSVSGTESKVDVSTLPIGAYLIEMTTDKGTLSRKNFVKK